MLSLEEMTGWSLDDIQASILAGLPDGWAFVPEVLEGQVHARFEDANGQVVWEDSSTDQRLLFFNAYGWLSLRALKARHPAWRPREKEVNPQADSRRGVPQVELLESDVKRRAASIPDPEDLDLAEVYSVYQHPHSKRE